MRKGFQQGVIWARHHSILLAAGGIFSLLAAKIAYVRQFPLAFDERFHFGLIQFYGHHLSPFLGAQPPEMNQYGAVARDPSYLYHYLMSFPYRLIAALTDSQLSQVWALRTISIGLGLISLALVYKLARRCGLPSLASQFVVAAVALTPVFEAVSGQINYDNLLIPAALSVVLLTLRASRELRTGRLSVNTTAGLISLLLLTSLIQYSFLPILMAIILYLGVVAWRTGLHKGLRSLTDTWSSAYRWKKIALVGVVLLSLVLWGQRYGVDIAEYHTPHPPCDAVLSVQACQAYGPWARNYALHQSLQSRPIEGSQTAAFTVYWVRWMFHQVFSSVRLNPDGTTTYTLDASIVVAKAAAVACLLGVLFGQRKLRRFSSIYPLFMCLGVAYTFALYLQNLSDFHNLHAFVALQGRYLLPILPLIYIGAAGPITVLFGAFARARFPKRVKRTVIGPVWQRLALLHYG